MSCTTCRLNNKENQPYAAKVVTLVKFTHFSTLHNSYVYPHVSVSAVDIVKERWNISSTSLDDWNNNFFFCWRFGYLEDEQKPVWTSLSINHQKLPCIKTGIAKPPKQVHMSQRWHMKDKWCIFSALKVLFDLKSYWSFGKFWS